MPFKVFQRIADSQHTAIEQTIHKLTVGRGFSIPKQKTHSKGLPAIIGDGHGGTGFGFNGFDGLFIDAKLDFPAGFERPVVFSGDEHPDGLFLVFQLDIVFGVVKFDVLGGVVGEVILIADEFPFGFYRCKGQQWQRKQGAKSRL